MTMGIHIWSTAPRLRLNPKLEFQPEYFEVVCLALSALMWRKLNGPIKFYADTITYDWFKGNDLLDLWDGGVDNTILDQIPETVNQTIFWAGSKLFALRAEPAPVAMVDTDIIIWKALGQKMRGPLTVLHREDLIDCYPPKEYLKIRPGYKFDPEWNWRVHPCNTAFAFFRDQEFKNQYADKAIDFMTGNDEYPMEMVSQMVFAEQRLLAMEAHKAGLKITSLVNDPYQSDNDIFTHLWGAKNIARRDPDQCDSLVRAMMNKIKELDPKIYEKLQHV